MAIKQIWYKENMYKISYTIVNPDGEKDVVFLHGWGSNKEIMQRSFGEHFGDFRHIYIDLPGFGNSSNDSVLCSDDYKNIVEIFLKNMNSDKYVIVGHSFGGKIATLLKPEMLVLLSSSGIIVPKSSEVKFKIKMFKFFKMLGLKRMYKIFASEDARHMSVNMYDTFKHIVNENFRDIFKAYEGKTLIFWGREDDITPLDMGRKIKHYIKDSKLFEYEGDHFFFAKDQNAHYISGKIHACLNQECESLSEEEIEEQK